MTIGGAFETAPGPFVAHPVPTRIYSTLYTEIGALTLTGDGEMLTGLYLPRHRHGPAVDPAWRCEESAFSEARSQISEYLRGERKVFSVALAPQGTAFQVHVWEALAQIPYGTTCSYGDIAAQLGSSARAVGHANARNPISIIIPCHRVIGHDGSLIGYGGGLDLKKRLLAHERGTAPSS